MPGEQLTCVLQLAQVKYGNTLPNRSMMFEVFSMFNSYKCLCYTKKEVLRDLCEKVTFSQLKEFIYSKRDKSTTKKEICDRIELACWRLCKSSYSKRVVDESDLFKLWQIFNILADEESYPPVISPQDAAWVVEKFASYQNSAYKRTQWEKGDLTFQHFINCLENNLDIRKIVQATKAIHEWLVKEVIKGGWVYVRIKRRQNWSTWLKKWMTLSPGKMLLSTDKNSKHLNWNTKSVFYVSEQTNIQTHKNENKGMANIIHVTNFPLYECHFATTVENEMHSWLNAFTESIKHYREGTSPVHTILKKQSREQPETISGLHIKDREESFIRSVTERSARKNAKDAGKIETKQKVSQRCLLRLNSVNTEKEKIKAVFLELDKNGNGYLEEMEFYLTLKEFGLNLSDSESKEIFRNIDADGDRKIAFNEFYDYFLEKILSEDKSALLKAFNEADREKRGAINFREFSEFVRDRHSTICLDKVLSTFDKLCKTDCSGELSFQDFQCMSILDDLDIFPDSTENFEALLKSRFDSTDPKLLRQKIENRWRKFASFRRQGANGSVVMKGANGIVEDVVPGEYNLKDLAKFVDLPTLLPKVTTVKGVSWESSNISNTSGNLVFPSDFNGILEVEVATSELLGFYGCTFADSRSEKVSLPYRHAVQDFTYENNYLADYVEKQNGGAGLERHGFSHLDCPLDENSGYFILGKMTGDELYITAFKIPKRHTLYIPENCIHSNDYLKGTWRTMLSDETDIDHVLLKRRRVDGEETCLQPFTFTFPSSKF